MLSKNFSKIVGSHVNSFLTYILSRIYNVYLQYIYVFRFSSSGQGRKFHVCVLAMYLLQEVSRVAWVQFVHKFLRNSVGIFTKVCDVSWCYFLKCDSNINFHTDLQSRPLHVSEYAVRRFRKVILLQKLPD